MGGSMTGGQRRIDVIANCASGVLPLTFLSDLAKHS
jgi:hypothetical protein